MTTVEPHELLAGGAYSWDEFFRLHRPRTLVLQAFGPPDPSRRPNHSTASTRFPELKKPHQFGTHRTGGQELPKPMVGLKTEIGKRSLP
jgi:hypothetical protein